MINNEITFDGDCCLMTVSGRLDGVCAAQFESDIKSEVDDTINKLILDFKDLQYISSAGLRVVLTAQKMMRGNKKLLIRNVQDMVMEVFEITGFKDLLEFE